MKEKTKHKLFLASYYKLLFADIKMYNFKIKTSFVSPETPKARANTISCFNIMIIHFYIRRKLDIIQYDT